VHKIDGPALVHRLGVTSGTGLRTGRRCFPLRRKFSFSRQ
jgi:hypothetical protein